MSPVDAIYHGIFAGAFFLIGFAVCMLVMNYYLMKTAIYARYYDVETTRVKTGVTVELDNWLCLRISDEGPMTVLIEKIMADNNIHHAGMIVR